METKRVGWKEKHNLYHDRVIDLHFNHGWTYHRISQLVPVSKSSIRNWIANFDPEKESSAFDGKTVQFTMAIYMRFYCGHVSFLK